MNEELKKFEALMKTDTAFREKLKSAMENYRGEQSEQAVFEAILVPLAKEYGISSSFEEFMEYMKGISSEDRELDDDEIDQIAGGKGGGMGITICAGIGAGIGGGGGDGDFGACVGVGAGNGVINY